MDEFLIPYVVSQIVALGLLLVAWRRTRLARLR